MLTVRWWQQRLYPRPGDFDAMAAFRRILHSYVTPASTVLDVGAGAGERNRYQLRGHCKEIIGLDLDPRVRTNPLLDRGVLGDAVRMPFPAETFDLAFSIYVLEHVAGPAGFVAEVNRVLKPGGHFLAITPNRWHYVAWLSMLTPANFHRWFRRKHYQVAEPDTFETWYRLNTRADLHRHFTRGGFETVRLDTVETSPNYLTFCLPAFLAGALYERLVNRSQSLADLRVNLLCVFRKPGA